MHKLHKLKSPAYAQKLRISHTADSDAQKSKWREGRDRAQRHQTHHDSLLPELDRRPCSPRLNTASARSPPLLAMVAKTTLYCSPHNHLK